MKRQAAWIGTVALAVGLSLMIMAHSLAQQALQVRVDRWLEVRQVANEVMFSHDAAPRSAQVGDRLQAVGDSITTGKKSTATLSVDTGVGVVEMAEQTTLRIRTLDIAPDQGALLTWMCRQAMSVCGYVASLTKGQNLRFKLQSG